MERAGLTEEQLTAAGRQLGRALAPGDVVLLDGPMGAGKTTFTRALAEGLGVLRPDRVRSPTYNLCLMHAGPRPLAHVDLFRLAQDDEQARPVGRAAFEALGLDELVDGSTPQVLVVEWARLWAEPPAEHLHVRLLLDPEHVGHRTLVAAAHGERARAVVSTWVDAASA